VKASLRRQLTVPVVLLALGATGCAQVNSGAIAARIGDRTISTHELVADIQAGAAPSASGSATTAPSTAPSTADGVTEQRTVLRTLVRLEELRLLAVRDSLPSTVSDADRSAQVTAFGGETALQTAMSSNGIPAGLRTQYLDTQVLAQRLLEKWVPVTDQLLQQTYQNNLAQFVQADVKFSTVPTQAAATTFAAKARSNPSSFDALATAANAPSQQTGLHAATEFGTLFGPQIAKASVNDVITGQSGQGWVVILVTNRVVQPLTAVKDQVAAQARSASSQEVFSQHFKALAASDPVQVNPRFGVWDPAASDIVAATGDTVQVSAPAASPQDTGLPADTGSSGATDTPSPGTSSTP
jgi:hypothetical protein